VKKQLLLLVGLVIAAQSFANNPFGNEWIHHNQQYFAVKIHESGMYRVSFATLQSAGMPVGTFDPRGFQVFFRGVEQPIFVRNEQTGLFRPGDFIEFFAERNDGQFDRELYGSEANHPNPAHSLFTDTATYYITWNHLLTNRRFTTETDVNFAGHTPAPFFWRTERMNFTSTYYLGEPNPFGATVAGYTRAQGWFDAAFTLGQTVTRTLPTPNPFTTGPPAQIELGFVSASNFAGANPDHHIQIRFAGLQIDTIFEGYDFIRINREVHPTQLNPAGTVFSFSSLNTLGSRASRNALSFISARYPHTWNLRNLGQLRLELPPAAGTKTLVEFTNFNAAPTDTVWIYDLGNSRRIPVVRSGDIFRALIPGAGQSRQLFLTSSARTVNIPRVHPVSTNPLHFARFRNFSDPEFANPTFIMVTHASLWAAAEQYRNYRISTGQRVLMVDIDELYHQFGYGTWKHPLALRNFIRYLLSLHPQNPPTYLFLLGKGIDARFSRNNAAHFAANLIPSAGDPSSDALITSGLDGRLFAPALATGRLAARNPAHVLLYLNKVKQYEEAQRQPQEWMKQILHFGGGSSQIEQVFLANYLNQYEEILEGPSFGGNVSTFLKSSTEPIQINVSDSIKRLINNGSSIMTFFGHASGVGFDLSIDRPHEYNNFGRYPFVKANSCFSGDIFSPSTSTSEEFVLIENRGAIAYLGSTSLSGSFELHKFSREFYNLLANEFYGRSMGTIWRETIRLLEAHGTHFKNISLYSAFHGDPALRFNTFPKPDFQVTTPDISFVPGNVTAELDSFTVRISALNLGRAITDSIMVELRRTFADGSVVIHLHRAASPLFRYYIDIRLPLDRTKGIGLNSVTVTLDSVGEVEEINEANNVATAMLFITSAELLPVIPPRYAIVPNPVQTLIASAGNPFAPSRRFIFEIDTNARFTNPIRHITTGAGGQISWNIPFILTDSTVYFWRVSPEPQANQPYNWRSSSFQHIREQTGWSQAHFDQFGQNAYQFVNYSPANRNWVFANNLVNVEAQTGFFPHMPFSENWLRIDGVLTRVFSCLGSSGNGMVFFVFDPVSGRVWESINQRNNLGQFGNLHCIAQNLPGFDFFTHTEEWRERIRLFIESIPDGHWVLAWSHRNHNAPAFSESLRLAFESLGSNMIRTLPHNMPYLLWGRKGQPPGSATEVIGQTVTSIIQLSENFNTNWNRGFIRSGSIGPASNWGSVHWRQHSVEQPATDQVSLDILGIRPGREPVTILQAIPPGQTDIFNLAEHIDASQFPYIQLQVNMVDDVHRTPAQMNRWQVMFEGVPEALLDPARHLVFRSDTLQEGQYLMFSTAITNVSSFDMDSLLVRYWVIDSQNNTREVAYPRQAPLRAGQSLIDTVLVNTRGLVGNNTLWVEVNPDHDQPELHRFNNIGGKPFHVIRDKANPILDVTIDGIRILNGDVVSPRPIIRINLTDENRFLALNDTSLVRVLLQQPGDREPRRIFFMQGGKEVMRFSPAILPNNTCVIEFQPHLLRDGTYTLKVQATDRSLNDSGLEDFQIDFEVVNESTITEVLNWPNPFSTATHFVFTLTGSELPTFFKIQIMTITGQVVREIDMSELGPIRIGRNITQFAWDGTDKFGDLLAPGVYLYRVITNIGGQSIEKRNTEASRFFHREMGKMFLVR